MSQTLHIGKKTHPRMLPQFEALESVPANDNPGVGLEQGADASLLATDVQHGRGETEVGDSCQPRRHPAKTGEPVESETGGRETPTVVAVKPVAGRVFVLDRSGKPLDPCHPARARKLLSSGRAVVVRYTPFIIRLTDRSRADSTVSSVGVKFDPGSRHTGISVVRSDPEGRLHGLVSIQVDHRGRQISEKLESRSHYRRRRRTANLRYRQPRFDNRNPAKCDACGANARHKTDFCRPCAAARRPRAGLRESRLTPSLRHRVESTMSVLDRLCRWAPVASVDMELVRFDTQAMQNPDICGVGYQQGTLAGYEVREYLLEKWGRKCVYCDASGVPLQIDHVRPRSKGGSNRISNLVAACGRCNQAKSNRPVEEFLATDPKRLADILKDLKKPLADTAAVNSTRWALKRALETTGLPVRAWSGGRTKRNRTRLGLAKTHTLDALCVGDVESVACYPAQVIVAKATGRGRYQRANPDSFGVAKGHYRVTKGLPQPAHSDGHKPRVKGFHGFQTGDLVQAVVPTGKKAGVHVGRAAVRATGSFNIKTSAGLVQGINHKHCTILQRSDGWGWSRQHEGGNDAA